MLVPIQFPDDLVVSDSGSVQIWQLSKISGSGLDAAEVIFPPGGMWADHEIESEQGDGASQDLFRYSLNLPGEGGPLQRRRDRPPGRQTLRLP